MADHSFSLAKLSAAVQAFNDERDWGQYHSQRNLAMEFSEAMSGFDSGALQFTTQEHAAAVVRGTYRGTWLEGYVGPSLMVTRALTNDPLERFAAAFASHGPDKAHAYLKGVAAVCSLAAQAVVVPEQGNLLPWFSEQTQTGRGASRTALAKANFWRDTYPNQREFWNAYIDLLHEYAERA